jgi:hypothetical protein
MKRLFALLLALILLAACAPAASVTAPIPTNTSAPTDTPGPTALPTLTVSPTPVADTLYVDPGQDLGPISPYIYGSNYSMYGAVPAESQQAALNSHVTTLRFPGGQWGNANDILPFNLDMFIAFCQKMGAMPTISVRFQGGTPEKAAELVRYANIERGYKITYWSIGNEPDYEVEDGKKIDPKDFNPRWRAIAQAMKAVDPTIQIMGPELSQWGLSLGKTAKYPPIDTPSPTRVDWMTEFLKANGDLVDIVTVHRYPKYAPSSPIPITPARLRENTLEWNQYVTYLRSLIRDLTGRDLQVAFTEVNSDPTPGLAGGVATPDSFYNAIWYADVLGRMIQERVFMVNQWVFAYRSGGLGLIFGSELRPTYYVFQMYAHFGSVQVLATSGIKYVDIFAAKRPDGTLTLMVINLLDNEQTLPLKVEGMTLSEAQVWRFDSTHNAEDLGKQSFTSDGTVTLPGQSITLYELGK